MSSPSYIIMHIICIIRRYITSLFNVPLEQDGRRNMKYKYLIFDADDTILDFQKAFRNTAKKVLQLCGVEFISENEEQNLKFADEAWAEVGLNDTNEPYVQENYHELYLKYLSGTFERWKNALNSNINIVDLRNKYMETLSYETEEIVLALETFRLLSNNYYTCIATNGFTWIQTGRLQSFIPYTHKLYISQEIGFIKPDIRFFEYIIQDLMVDVSECLMIGDSLSNDIQGACNIGMDTCWFNPKQKSNYDNIPIKYEIRKLDELLLL